MTTLDWVRFSGVGVPGSIRVARGGGAGRLLFLPAMGVSATYYDPFLSALAEEGIDAAVLELRGQGESPLRARRGVDFGYLELIREDVPAAIEAFGEKPVLAGHSLGGHLAMMFAAERPTAIAALALVACGSPWPGGYGGRGWARAYFGTRTMAAVSRLLGWYPGHRLGFGGKQPRQLILDWARMARDRRYHARGSTIDYEAELARLPLEVLALSIESDLDAPPAAVDAVVDKLPAERLTRRHLTAAELAPRALDHQRWAREPGIVAELFAAHAREHAAGRGSS